jgi:hypothetical protein
MVPRRTLLPILAFSLLASTHANLEIEFDTLLPQNFVKPTYLSFNIDTGSLYNKMDLNDPVLTNLVKSLAAAAPTELRMGGSAADDVTYTGPSGQRGPCSLPNGAKICVDDSLWSEIHGFVNATGVSLVWDLRITERTEAGAWNSSNAVALLAHTAAAGYHVGAWQLGNEVEDMIKHGGFINGTQIGHDFRALSALLRDAYPQLSPTIYGPDACCENLFPTPGTFLSEFVASAADAVAAITIHDYPLGRTPAPARACNTTSYTNKQQFRSLVQFIANYTSFIEAGGGSDVPIILDEVASTAEGGCDLLSNRFIASFVFLYELASVAESGVVQMNRQDIVGWSSEGTPSNYALLGVPGWVSTAASGAPAPHPDYYVALLWKQLVGTAVLSSQYSGDGDATFDAHVWCSSGAHGVPSGVPVIAFASMSDASVELAIPAGLPSTTPRTEFFVTSSATPAPPNATSPGAPPASVYGDVAFLNGVQLSVNADGTLPQFPLRGRKVVGAGPVTLPPWSVGFIVLAHSVEACQ